MPALVGRDRETAIVDTFLRELRGGPAGLVVEGAAGTGKTRLWEEALARGALHSVRLLQARPAPFETQIAYSGLFDLLRDTADDVLRILPRPQRRALAAALLLEEGEGHAAEPRAVAVAFATGVRALACDGPVLVAVDDEPLLDQPSADALRYTTRRLRDETVGLLATRRASGEPPLPLELAALGDRRVRRLVLEPLPFAAVRELLRAHLGVALPAPVVRRIHQRSGGNPFFALELGRALQRRGGPAPDEPLPASLSGIVQERVAALSADARRLLYLAAVQREPSLGSLDQPDIVPEPRPALDEALRAGVVELAGDQIRFAHPLLAEAVVAQAGLAERIALHRRLAEHAPTAEERARHRSEERRVGKECRSRWSPYH